MDYTEISSSLSNEQFRNVLNERLKVLFKRVKAHSLGSSIIVPLNQGGTGQALTDPGADRILFWDDSDSAIEWLQCGNSIAITTNTIDTIQDIRTSASPTFVNITGTGLIKGATGNFGNVAGGNYCEIESDGTIHLIGDATVYNDLLLPISTGKIPGASFPAWTTFLTNINAYTFAVNNYIDCNFTEGLHDRKDESNIEIHVHWATNGVDGTDRAVKWEAYYTWANKDGVFTESTLQQETTITANTADRTHMYTSLGTVTGTGKTLNNLIGVQLKRIASAGTAPSNDPFGLMVGIHYQVDTPGGSRAQTTK